MSRAGRGPGGEPAGDLDHRRDAAGIVDRAVADPVGLAFAAGRCRDGPNGRGTAAISPLPPLPRSRPITLLRGRSGWTAVVDLDRRAERQGDGAEGRAGLVVEQPLEIAAGGGDQPLRRGLRHRADDRRGRRGIEAVVAAGGRAARTHAAQGTVGADDGDHRRGAGLGHRLDALG